MSEYLDFPPFYFFEIALKHCPEAALLYKELWRFFDKELSDLILKDDVLDKFGLSPTRFRNHLVLLKREGLLEFKQNRKSYKIDLTPFDVEKA